MQRKNAKKTPPLHAPHVRFGIVVSRYNSEVTKPMLDGALAALRAAGVRGSQTTVIYVPGSYEIPYGCLKLIEKKCKALVALGCIIKGQTEHDRHIASAVSNGIMELMLEHRVPIAFGVLTTNNLAQARARSRGANNKGIEAARAAIEMAAF